MDELSICTNLCEEDCSCLLSAVFDQIQPVSGRSGSTYSSDAAASTSDEDGLVEETRGVEDGHGGE